MLGAAHRAAVLSADDGHPARLFGPNDRGLCLPSVATAFMAGAMAEDSAGASPAAVGLRVGRIGYQPGASSVVSQATATKRPLLVQDPAGILCLRFDGIDDCLSATGVDFTNTPAATVLIGVRKNTTTATGAVFEHGTAGSSGAFGVFAPVGSQSAGHHIYIQSRGTADSGWYHDISASGLAVFGCVVVPGGTTRAEKFPSYALNGNPAFGRYAGGASDPQTAAAFQSGALHIGQRNAASFPFSGDLYSLVVIGRALPQIEMLRSMLWINRALGKVY